MFRLKEISIVVGVIVLTVFCSGCVSVRSSSENEYSIGRDTYKAFGNGRVQAISPGEEMYIRDSDNRHLTISTVEKYVVQDDMLFIEGYYMIGYGETFIGENIISSYYPNGELTQYKSLDEIPYYTVIDINTGEAEFFLQSDILSDTYLEVFDNDIDWWCKLRRTCWEK